MKTKTKIRGKMTRAEIKVLNAVAAQVKDRILFTEKVEDAKRHLQQLKNSKH
ncbi:MAG: hypothetical protein J0I32_21155 [Sphingobacteriales bacterium]|nr:hypothetical protein [Sphingobacteriales bacterium]